MTRNCTEADYLLPSVEHYFPLQNTLTPELAAFSLQRCQASKHCITVIDIEHLGEILQRTVHKKKIVTWLSPAEKKIFTAFSYAKRRAEWLGGRIAVKTAANLLVEDCLSVKMFPHVEILPRENGSPEINYSFQDAQQLSISISHSGKFAVGMVSDASSCGIDIQKITDQTGKVISKFAQQEELRMLETELPGLQTPQQLALLWSAKEAFKKSLLRDQPVIFKGVTLKKICAGNHLELHLHHSASQSRPSEIQVVILGEYVLAVTTQNANHA